MKRMCAFHCAWLNGGSISEKQEGEGGRESRGRAREDWERERGEREREGDGGRGRTAPVLDLEAHSPYGTHLSQPRGLVLVSHDWYVLLARLASAVFGLVSAVFG
jgi:hypothetical protein